ncbi:MAG: (deoxy)nucleoside triphosphate pyrophosphohydrolase [Micrococcaceae bacterium]
MKTIKVVAAVIHQNGKVLATQRGYGDFVGGWEFPGGKIEQNEKPTEALTREIKEELNVDLKVGKHIITVNYDYPKFHLEMACYLCTLEGEIKLLEHQDSKWVDKATIDNLEWLPADLPVVEKIKETLF